MTHAARLAALLLAAISSIPASGAATEAERAVARAAAPESVRWLGDGAARFLALFRAAHGAERRGAMLLVARPGAHADWPEVIRPLAVAFARYGWDTLALGLPEPRALSRARFRAEALARLDAGRALLTQQGAEWTAVVGHGAGAGVALAALAREGGDGFQAYVGVSPREAPGGPAVAVGEHDVPMLEVRGERDPPPVAALVARHARERQRSGQGAYRSLAVPGAGPWGPVQGLLVKRVRGWLKLIREAEGQ